MGESAGELRRLGLSAHPFLFIRERGYSSYDSQKAGHGEKKEKKLDFRVVSPEKTDCGARWFYVWIFAGG